MPIDIGDIPTGTPPTTGEKLQIRTAIGLGQTDAPTFLAQTLTGALTASETGASKNPAVAFPVSGSYAVGVWSPAQYTIQLAMAPAGTLTNTTAYTGLQYEMTAGTLSWGVSSQTIKLARDADGILAQRNGTAAQAFRVYNTFPGTTANEWFEIDWKTTANTVRLFTNQGGTGGARAMDISAGATLFLGAGSSSPIRMYSGGVERWQISANGHLMSAGVTDNLYDIGASGANRPRDVYAGGNGIFGGVVSAAFGFRAPSSSQIIASSDGIWRLTNSSVNDFNRLQFGSTTDAFPAIARDGAGIKFTGAAAGSTSWIKVPPVAVASLPSAATAGVGARAFVNNALNPVFGNAVVGSGLSTVPVYSDGTNWNVG
jgi:hypothetical protein